MPQHARTLRRFRAASVLALATAAMPVLGQAPELALAWRYETGG